MSSAARPFLAKNTKRRRGVGDQNPCTSNETVTAKERLKRRGEQKKECDQEGGEPRAKAQDERQIGRTNNASLDQSKRDKKEARERQETNLREQLNDAQKKGEAREAHRLSRMVAGRGMGARRRHQPRIPAIRQCLEEGVKTLEQPINKGGCSGLLITFSDDVECMQERSVPVVVDQNAIQHGHRDWTFLQAAVWKLRHWRASVAWSIPAELLKILIFPNGGAQ